MGSTSRSTTITFTSIARAIAYIQQQISRRRNATRQTIALDSRQKKTVHYERTLPTKGGIRPPKIHIDGAASELPPSVGANSSDNGSTLLVSAATADTGGAPARETTSLLLAV